MGVFFNTLALRNYPRKDKTFVDFLKEVKKNTLDAFENQDYQFDDLVEKVAPDRDAGRNPIHNVKLVLLNVDTRDLEIPGLRLKLVDFENKTTKLDLGLSGAEVGGELLFTFEYSTALFGRDTIEEFIEYFKNIVSSVLDDPGQRLYEIGRITGVKREKILSRFTGELENE
jgi:non-ribosomal peptide synthetase component F